MNDDLMSTLFMPRSPNFDKSGTGKSNLMNIAPYTIRTANPDNKESTRRYTQGGVKNRSIQAPRRKGDITGREQITSHL